ncbi:hypothetical protein BDB00DRAFT_849148 [Zychaea mexicana]|uniref:uncharacterized protein n=1 Tax=Zychaea mexicana TaxID=64656 RepID=UPI0022FE9C8E|nr:uncharacterized protein BDB00DRAFT_849148 [Zychaea mexicana]KAI9488233.1 hypothetical protein BDB00DRAFT_849148 [Zychaea mexicana]
MSMITVRMSSATINTTTTTTVPATATNTTPSSIPNRRKNSSRIYQEKDVLLIRDNPKQRHHHHHHQQVASSPPRGILVTDPVLLTTKATATSNRPLPSVLTDFMAVTMCDLLPKRYRPSQRKVPGLLYFIQNVTAEANISCHVAIVALIYLERCKQALPKNATGDDDTAHRIFVAALLVADKFLQGTTWTSHKNRLTNARMAKICSMYTLEQVNQLECSFLNLIKHQCWVNDLDVQSYLLRHRQDLLL